MTKRFVTAAASLAMLAAVHAFAQSTGGTPTAPLNPPRAGSMPMGKAAIAGSNAVGEASRNPALGAANGAAAAQAKALNSKTPELPPQPRTTQPNKDYAGGTVAPAGGP